jgi:hypothetical protein
MSGLSNTWLSGRQSFMMWSARVLIYSCINIKLYCPSVILIAWYCQKNPAKLNTRTGLLYWGFLNWKIYKYRRTKECYILYYEPKYQAGFRIYAADSFEFDVCFTLYRTVIYDTSARVNLDVLKEMLINRYSLMWVWQYCWPQFFVLPSHKADKPLKKNYSY